ncbi:uncharacterized protein RSE6_00797 [Rhynchosporium secalis]|uniref:Uncharacterized protein n=1 Tax=Rhynchosporium secalis TaxID=38038 RepID=A0A1E1LW68_RHYSE|nr:uncharacterized protein RSE6_00797 [Rhynchosporium secalis]
MTAKYGSKATKLSALVHLASALLENLTQALFLASLFVWMEILFNLGCSPELQKRLEASVRVGLERLRVLKEEKKEMEKKKRLSDAGEGEGM